jgi:hypothetical protein
MIRIKKQFRFLITLFFVFTAAFSPLSAAKAISTEQLKDVPDTDNFDIGPTLHRVEANPSETFSRTLQITNRSGEKDSFSFSVGNFKGGYSGVDFLENEDIVYGAKDWIRLERDHFSLEHGERAFITVTVNVPANAVPGDNYAAVFLTRNLNDSDNKPKGQNINIVSRAAVLFVINVPGETTTSGSLKRFSSSDKIYYDGPFKFETAFENQGNVWLKPYGTIEIKSLTGKTVKTINIEPFKVYREATTLITHESQTNGLWPGRYSAVLTLNRGYENLTDTTTITFWFLPWRTILKYLAIIIFALVLVRVINKKFYFHFGARKRR